MANKIQIINLALRRIGESTIGDIDEGSKAANVMKDIYDLLLETELRQWPFTWATTTQELAQLTTEEPPDFAYAFALPSNYLQFIKLLDTQTGSTFSLYEPWYDQYKTNYNEFEVRENKLYTNYSEVTMKYIYLQEDTSKWDASFVDAFAWKLAQESAIPIAGRDDQMQNAFNQYLVSINKARASSGSETRRSTELGTKFVRAR